MSDAVSPSGGQVSSLESERRRGDGVESNRGKGDGRDFNLRRRIWEGAGAGGSAADYPAGVMSRVCGPRGVTSGPRSPQYMFTSLRTPNSPVR